MPIKQENQDFEPTEYATPSYTLDNLLGPLELALAHSDHKIQRDYMLVAETAKDPYYEVEEVTCEHCKKDYPSSTWFFKTHLPNCKLSNKRINIPKIPNKTKLGCPVCRKGMRRDKLMSHFHHEGPLKCQEYWRTSTVVEKKFVYPFYDIQSYEDCLPKDLCDSKFNVSQHLGYCPNCGMGVVNQAWFLDCHLLSCLEKAMREGTLSSFDPLTGMCIGSD